MSEEVSRMINTFSVSQYLGWSTRHRGSEIFQVYQPLRSFSA